MGDTAYDRLGCSLPKRDYYRQQLSLDKQRLRSAVRDYARGLPACASCPGDIAGDDDGPLVAGESEIAVFLISHPDYATRTPLPPSVLPADSRDPLGTDISRRSRTNVFAQTGLREGGAHPIRLLLEVHGIDIDELIAAALAR